MITSILLAVLPSFCSPGVCAPSAPLALAQDLEDVTDEQEKKKPSRATAWPEVPKELKKDLKTEISRLRKANTEEMGAGGRDALLKLGALAAPDLLKALEKERGEEARERIVDVLENITAWEHTQLLATLFASRSEHVRLFTLRRAAAFPDEGIRGPAMAAFKAAEKRLDTKKEITHELYYAALAVVSSGDLTGVAVLSKRAEKLWGKSSAEIRIAVEAVRGEEATAMLGKQIEGGERKQVVAGLRLLAGCGSPESGKAIAKKQLNSTDNSIRVAAINALRGIVDGDPPIDKLSVFQAVELANKWKTR
jgi:hypothetical protein